MRDRASPFIWWCFVAILPRLQLRSKQWEARGHCAKQSGRHRRETHWEPKWQTLCSRTPAQVWENSRVEVLKSTMLESGTGCYSVISSVLKFEELYSHLSRYVCRIRFCKAVAGHYAGFFFRGVWQYIVANLGMYQVHASLRASEPQN